MNRGVSWFSKIFLKPIVDRILIKEVRGLENIPKGNFILAANHQSHLDQIATGYVCVPRRFHMIGQTDRYSGLTKLFLYFLYFIAGVIPLNREKEESRKKALEEAVKVLKKGDILVIYPEGTRTRTGKMGKGKLGVAKIFLRTGLPILPVGIKGTFNLLPPGGKLKIKREIEIRIGKPLYFEEEFEKAKNLDCNSENYQKILQSITDKVMQEINNLIE
ncbi:MAG: lysophospholipid acyltransferase family protein [Patescibacteria group bacterium]|nr:lysophospholipid acyltransferase family protein [Patescibacteria group bacterium]